MPVKLTVVVFNRPNMFEVQDSYFNMCGYHSLKALFTNPNFRDAHKDLTLYYPERFLNVIEQRALLTRIRAQEYEEVLIVTHSVYIIQTAPNHEVRVVQGNRIDETDGLFKLSNDAVGLPLNLGQLQIAGV